MLFSAALDINLSATLEQALKEKLAQSEAIKWLDEKNTIRAYNDFIGEQGQFGDEYRAF